MITDELRALYIRVAVSRKPRSTRRAAKRRSRTIEDDLRGRLGHGSLSLAENGDLLGERASSFGAGGCLASGVSGDLG